MPPRRLSAKLREAGLAYTLYLAGRRLVPRRLMRLEWFSVFERSLPEAAGPPPSMEDIRWAGAEDLPSLCGLGWAAGVLEERLRRGDRVCVLCEQGAVVAYCWFRAEAYDEAGARFVLAGDELWGYDALVARGLRGRRLGPRVIQAAAADLAREGTRRILSSVDNLNRNMLRVQRTTGARPLASMLVLRAVGFTLVRDRRPEGVRWRAATRGRLTEVSLRDSRSDAG